MGKLFGTDGIRGVVNDGLDAMLAFRVGMAAAQVMTREKGGGQPRFTIGKDTRISSDLLEGALIAGLCSAGADVLHLGVIPTPAVACNSRTANESSGVGRSDSKRYALMPFAAKISAEALANSGDILLLSYAITTLPFFTFLLMKFASPCEALPTV